jgi:hypothetical protein
VREEACDEANMILTGIINIYLMSFLNHGLKLDHDLAERSVRLFLEGVGTNHPEPKS